MGIKKLSSMMYIILFALLIVLVGFISAKNLVNFYVNDEVDYNEWSADLGDKFETDVATTFFEKFQFVNLNGAFRNLLGQQEMNGVVKLNNGYLLTTIGYVDDDTLQGYADSVAYLNYYLQSRGTYLVYAMTPYTSGKYNPQLPVGVEDYGNNDADRLMAMLDRYGIDTIDFRDKMYEDGIDHYDMMYKTDHHWNTEAGFYAYGILEDYIVGKTGCKVDERISNIDNYTVTKYKNWHLGSRGQRTGRYFAGIDDFDLIIPNFETQIQNDAGDVGNMQDIVINMEPLSKKEYTSRYTYDWVLGNSLGHYINLNSENDTKILIVTDSFGKAVNPFLMMGFSEIEYVYDRDVSGINPNYIEEYDPDVVILMYYADNAMGNGAYTFDGFK
jgi:hypothetical protein